jgi:lysyl-tRNA synthetase class 2
MTEVEDLVADMLAPHRRLAPAERLTYASALLRHAGVDTSADDAALDAAIAAHGIRYSGSLDHDARLDLLMSHVVGPRLGVERPCFIIDYPASQAALARLKPGSPPVAARFELYLDGIELANGFHELADADEQRSRFEQDLVIRRARNQVSRPLDARLLAALAHGIPDCAGVALGFDRLAAIAMGAKALADVMAFAVDRA